MYYKSKPGYYRSLDKTESFLIAIGGSALCSVVLCFVDMAITGKSGSDPLSPWFIEVIMYLITCFPLTWVIVHQTGRVKYFFKEYLPWKKYMKEYQAHHDEIDLNRERKLTEVFIREVRRK